MKINSKKVSKLEFKEYLFKEKFHLLQDKAESIMNKYVIKIYLFKNTHREIEKILNEWHHRLSVN